MRVLASIKGLNYIGRVNTYNKIKQIYDLRKDGGIAYRNLSGKPKEAINKLMQERKGWVPAAQRKKGLGEIDYIWGKHNPETNIGGGLEYIEFQRTRQGIDTNQFIKKLLEFDTEDLKQNNPDSSKKFIQMLLKQEKEI